VRHLEIIIPLVVIGLNAALLIWLRLYVDPRVAHRQAIRARLLSISERRERVSRWS
jgi:hypothetical protein